MKYVAGIVLGIVVGAVLGVGAIYVNPLTANAAGAPPAGGWTFQYAFPQGGSLLLTHRGIPGLPLQPAGVERLWEATINDSVLNVLVLKGTNGAPTAVATRLAKPSAGTDLLLRGAIADDYWLVTVAGAGSFFVHSKDNLWPMLKDTFIPGLLGRNAHGPASYAPTVGPAAGHLAVAFGATGRFARMRGTATETYRVDEFDAGGGLKRLSGDLYVRLQPAAPTH